MARLAFWLYLFDNLDNLNFVRFDDKRAINIVAGPPGGTIDRAASASPLEHLKLVAWSKGPFPPRFHRMFLDRLKHSHKGAGVPIASSHLFSLARLTFCL